MLYTEKVFCACIHTFIGAKSSFYESFLQCRKEVKVPRKQVGILQRIVKVFPTENHNEPCTKHSFNSLFWVSVPFVSNVYTAKRSHSDYGQKRGMLNISKGSRLVHPPQLSAVLHLCHLQTFGDTPPDRSMNGSCIKVISCLLH